LSLHSPPPISVKVFSRVLDWIHPLASRAHVIFPWFEFFPPYHVSFSSSFSTMKAIVPSCTFKAFSVTLTTQVSLEILSILSNPPLRLDLRLACMLVHPIHDTCRMCFPLVWKSRSLFNCFPPQGKCHLFLILARVFPFFPRSSSTNV